MRTPRRVEWVPELRGDASNIYLQLVDAIAADIQSGRLSASDRLPAKRDLAARLNVHYATVSRAYQEAQRRGLIYSRVGRGTFVCRPRVSQLSLPRGQSVIDMTMNLPPEPQDSALLQRLEDGMEQLTPRLRELLRYEDFGGSLEARRAGTAWLGRLALDVDPERLRVCPGAQSALHACLSLLAKPGDVALCEDITYPGVRNAAKHLGIRLIGLPMDAEGISSEALDRACAEHHPKLLYCNPTLQNPTTRTISAPRRRELASVARSHGIAIVEDDAYGMLPSAPLEPLARIAPDLTYYISGFAKCLGPGLRVAYLVAPDARRAARVSAVLRATNIMASPITIGLATEYVENGTAEAALLAIRAESSVRQRIAEEALARARYDAHPEAFHLWLALPEAWRMSDFSSALLGRGIQIVTSDAFAVRSDPPKAVRVCLGGPCSRDEIRDALARIAQLSELAPSASSET